MAEIKDWKDRVGKMKVANPLVVIAGVAAVVGIVYFMLWGSPKRKDAMEDYDKEVVAKKQAEASEQASHLREATRQAELKDRELQELRQQVLARQSGSGEGEGTNDVERDDDPLEPDMPLSGKDTTIGGNTEERKQMRELLYKSYMAPLKKYPAQGDARAEGEVLAASVPLPGEEQPFMEPTPVLPGGMATIAAGTWIPAVLTTDQNSEAPGWSKALIKENVYSDDGYYVVIPKGSVALIEIVQSGGYDLVAESVKLIVLPNGNKLTIPLPVHDVDGIAQLQPDKIERHFWRKMGMSIMLATIGGVASVSGPNVYTAEGKALQAMAQSTGQAAQDLLKQYTNIPDRKIVRAGHSINIFLYEEWKTRPYSRAGQDEVVANQQKKIQRELEYMQQTMNALSDSGYAPEMKGLNGGGMQSENYVYEFYKNLLARAQQQEEAQDELLQSATRGMAAQPKGNAGGGQ